MCECVPKSVFASIFECVLACCFASAHLQFFSLSGKDIAEGDKQTHLTLCPHGNQGTEQKKKRKKERNEMEGETRSLGEGIQTDAQGWREERKQGHVRLSSWISTHPMKGSRLSCSTL